MFVVMGRSVVKGIVGLGVVEGYLLLVGLVIGACEWGAIMVVAEDSYCPWCVIPRIKITRIHLSSLFFL